MKAVTRDFMARILRDLTEAGKGKEMRVDARWIVMEDMPGRDWREDADTYEEWFIKLCRAHGLHATYLPGEHKYKVRLTEDAADEATITWPGAVFSRTTSTPEK